MTDPVTPEPAESAEQATPLGPATRYDRRRAQTRRVLVDAGRQLIASHGVEALRIQDITEGADVGLGSFYNHFASKDELVEAVVEESLSDLAAATGLSDANREQDPAVTTADAIVRVLHRVLDEREFGGLLVNLSRADLVFEHAMQPRAREVVVAGVEAGRFAVPDVDVATDFIVAGAMSIIRRLVAGGPEDIIAAYAALALRALGLTPDEAESVGRARADAARI